MKEKQIVDVLKTMEKINNYVAKLQHEHCIFCKYGLLDKEIFSPTYGIAICQKDDAPCVIHEYKNIFSETQTQN